MDALFKLLGALLAIYTVVAVVRGEVLAKDKAWGRRYRRDADGRRFWIVVAIYAGLSIALLTVF